VAYIPRSEDEKEYLKKYNPNDWPKPSVAADIAVFAYGEDRLHLLLVQRGNYPYKGNWALPGGFANMDEDLHETAGRELEEETGLKNVFLEQVSMWGKPGRDPRDRTITALHMALVEKAKARVQAGDDASAAKWFTVENYIEKRDFFEEERVVRTKKLILDGETVLAPQVRETVCYGEGKCVRTEITDDSDLAFDHAHCIMDAYGRLKERLLCSDFAYGVLGRTFELGEMKKLYDAVFLKSWPLSQLAQLKMIEEVGGGKYGWMHA
jgi:ADP-ribose pyrophosphatase YjhB (NUDIX family)